MRASDVANVPAWLAAKRHMGTIMRMWKKRGRVPTLRITHWVVPRLNQYISAVDSGCEKVGRLHAIPQHPAAQEPNKTPLVVAVQGELSGMDVSTN